MQERRFRSFLIVVEDEYKTSWCGRSGAGMKPAEEVLEIAEGKGLDPHEILGSQQRQGHLVPRRGLLCSQAQIVKKCRRICIACVHLVPQAGKLPGVEVTGDEGGLTAACRPGYPYDGMAPAVVQKPEKPLSFQDPGYTGPCYLCKGRTLMLRLLLHRPPKRYALDLLLRDEWGGE
jgi:hypothetical protein